MNCQAVSHCLNVRETKLNTLIAAAEVELNDVNELRKSQLIQIGPFVSSIVCGILSPH